VEPAAAGQSGPRWLALQHCHWGKGGAAVGRQSRRPRRDAGLHVGVAGARGQPVLLAQQLVRHHVQLDDWVTAIAASLTCPALLATVYTLRVRASPDDASVLFARNAAHFLRGPWSRSTILKFGLLPLYKIVDYREEMRLRPDKRNHSICTRWRSQRRSARRRGLGTASFAVAPMTEQPQSAVAELVAADVVAAKGKLPSRCLLTSKTASHESPHFQHHSCVTEWQCEATPERGAAREAEQRFPKRGKRREKAAASPIRRVPDEHRARPDKPLVLTCEFRSAKKVTRSPAQNKRRSKRVAWLCSSW
jgi:hypothetical protein